MLPVDVDQDMGSASADTASTHCVGVQTTLGRVRSGLYHRISARSSITPSTPEPGRDEAASIGMKRPKRSLCASLLVTASPSIRNGIASWPCLSCPVTREYSTARPLPGEGIACDSRCLSRLLEVRGAQRSGTCATIWEVRNDLVARSLMRRIWSALHTPERCAGTGPNSQRSYLAHTQTACPPIRLSQKTSARRFPRSSSDPDFWETEDIRHSKPRLLTRGGRARDKGPGQISG
jgi:hypothetical protein